MVGFDGGGGLETGSGRLQVMARGKGEEDELLRLWK